MASNRERKNTHGDPVGASDENYPSRRFDGGEKKIGWLLPAGLAALLARPQSGRESAGAGLRILMNTSTQPSTLSPLIVAAIATVGLIVSLVLKGIINRLLPPPETEDYPEELDRSWRQR